MVGGPNGTTSDRCGGDDLLFVARGVHKVVRVWGKKKRVTLRPRNFRVTVPPAGPPS